MVLKVEPLATRTDRIKNAHATGRLYPVRFRGELKEIPVKRIPTSSLVYRMANIRTIVRQKAVISDTKLPPDFFTSGQENTESQNKQHEILVKMSKDPTANIYESLGQNPELTDPLLITSTGVVLNGNRRLAAIRDLHEKDAVTYRAFTHVEVAVLPEDCTEDDLSEIETYLQIAPDLKSDYGWVEEALGLRLQLDDLQWSLAKASSAWGQSENELQNRLDELAAAEDYLSYLGKPGRYELVEDDKQAVQTFVKTQKSQRGVEPSVEESQRHIMHVVLSDPDIDGRKYEYAKDIPAIAAAVVKEVDVPASTPATGLVQPAGPLSALSPSPEQISAEVLDFLSDRSNAAVIARLAEDVLSARKDEKRAKKRRHNLLDSVRQAFSKIAGVGLTNAEPETYPEVASNLVALQLQAAQLLAEVIHEDSAVVKGLEKHLLDDLTEAIEHLLTEISSASE